MILFVNIDINVNEIIIEDNDSPYHMVMAKFAVLITGNKI